MSQHTVLVLGTRNRKKRRELEVLLQPYQLEVATLDDFRDVVEVAETGATFAQNAALKATEYARQLNRWVLGEDSGLVVDALNGAPGVYSARYAGVDASDEANNQKLLQALTSIPDAQRSAHYVSSIALADDQGAIRATAESYCCGRIRHRPSGQAGFGYDPLFEVLEYHQTFGELGDTVKALISHRARATREILPTLVRLMCP